MKTLTRTTKTRKKKTTVRSTRVALPTALKVKVKEKTKSQVRLPYARLAFFALVLGALFGVTLIQAQLVSPQQELDSLSVELGDLREQRSVLEHEVAIASAPERIIERAGDLGLVPIPDLVPIEGVVSE